jgi:hypothetical protein
MTDLLFITGCFILLLSRVSNGGNHSAPSGGNLLFAPASSRFVGVVASIGAIGRAGAFYFNLLMSNKSKGVTMSKSNQHYALSTRLKNARSNLHFLRDNLTMLTVSTTTGFKPVSQCSNTQLLANTFSWAEKVFQEIFQAEEILRQKRGIK